jgi:hypothetical protein
MTMHVTFAVALAGIVAAGATTDHVFEVCLRAADQGW